MELMSLAFATWKVMLSDEGQGCGETQSFWLDFFPPTAGALLWPALQQVTGRGWLGDVLYFLMQGDKMLPFQTFCPLPHPFCLFVYLFW